MPSSARLESFRGVRKGSILGSVLTVDTNFMTSKHDQTGKMALATVHVISAEGVITKARGKFFPRRQLQDCASEDIDPPMG